MLGESNNNQCLLIILLGVALFLLMRKPHSHRGGRGKMMKRDARYEGMEVGDEGGATASTDATAPTDTPVTTVPMTDNGAMVVPVQVPERMPINEQSVGSCSYKSIVEPVPSKTCGTSLVESPTNWPYVNARSDTMIDGTGVDGTGSPYNEVLGSNIPANYYFLDDGANGEMSTTNNMVSSSCCGVQWPTPFKQAKDPYLCGNKDDFVSSRSFGNTIYSDSGCLCQTKKQAQFLANRGANGGSWN
jgi:hypothetical protein